MAAVSELADSDPARAQGEHMLRTLVRRVSAAAWTVWLVRPAVLGPVAGLVALGALAGLWILVVGTGGVQVQAVVLFLAAAVPVALGLAGALFAAANGLLRWSLGLSEDERAYLALHLPRSVFGRLRWGAFLRNWLYRGQWLLRPATESPPAYMHLFYTGPALADVAQETALWRTVHASLPYGVRDLCLPGATARRVQHVDHLPHWALVLDGPSDGYALSAVLDGRYGDWARRFLSRARRRLGLSGEAGVDFVLVCLDADRDRRVLAAMVWPRALETAPRREAPAAADLAAA